MDKMLLILVAAAVFLLVGIIMISQVSILPEDIGSFQSESKDVECESLKSEFEEERESESLNDAKNVKQRAEERGCEWSEDVDLNFEPEGLPCRWTTAC